MDRRFAAACAGQLLMGIAGDHFIDVHVGLGARYRLQDNQRKLIVQFARLERDGRVLYGAGDLLIQSMLGIYLSRSEEHTSELQSLMRSSYAVFCLKKQK